ncbi:MAG TPA: hypothetical protein VFO42_09545 [Sphingomicrobium sp.]|nr:hypothetical protein [Sphingomicrobium sp.]
MTNSFDDRLAAVLAPPDREPDRDFVLRVTAGIALADRLEARRSALIRSLAGQLAAIASVAASIMILGRSPAVARFAAESPPGTLAALLVSFSFVAVLLVPGIMRGTGGRSWRLEIART